MPLITLHQRASNNTIHEHHLHKGVWIPITLFVVCTLLIVMLINSYNKIAALRANDIKYRLFKLNAGKNLSKVLYHLDSLYDANPEGVTKETLHQEDILLERVKQLRSAGEKEGLKEFKKVE